MDHKLIFLETKDVVETTLALDNYNEFVIVEGTYSEGRHEATHSLLLLSLFFSISRGKVAEGIDFDRHDGRCVICPTLFGPDSTT